MYAKAIWCAAGVLLAVGAGALLVLGAGTVLGPHVLGLHTTDARSQQTLASVRFIKRGLSVAPPRKSAGPGAVEEALYQAYRLLTGTDEQASVSFVDSSVLQINQRTDLTLHSPAITYLAGGEADVIDAPGAHHSIQTATATVTALGTEYDIRVTPAGKSVQVTVAVVSGSVRVQTAKGARTVGAGQEVTVSPNGTISTPRPFSAQTAIGWTQGLPASTFTAPTATPGPLPTATSPAAPPPQRTGVAPQPTIPAPLPTSQAPPTQPAEAPAASFSPSSGHQGDTFILSASGFQPNVTLDVTLTRPDGVVEHYSITTDGSGTGAYTFSNTQNVVTGTYSATVTNPATNAQAQASVDVLPAP